MGKITNEKDYVQVEIDPEQLVFRKVPLKGNAVDLNLSYGDLIAHTAWILLQQIAPKFAKGRQFRFRACDVVDGKFVATFHIHPPQEGRVPPLYDAQKEVK